MEITTTELIELLEVARKKAENDTLDTVKKTVANKVVNQKQVFEISYRVKDHLDSKAYVHYSLAFALGKDVALTQAKEHLRVVIKDHGFRLTENNVRLTWDLYIDCMLHYTISDFQCRICDKVV